MVTLLFLSVSWALAQDNVHLEGNLTYCLGPSDADKAKVHRFTFEVLTDGRHFRITTRPAEKADCYEQVLVGDTTYGLYRHAANPQHHSAEINRRAFPRDDGTGINYLWLAYASAGYLDSRATNRLEPIWLLDDPHLAMNGFTQEATWKRFSCGLPRSIVYLNDGNWRRFNGHESQVAPWPSPFHQGFTNAAFVTGGATNLGTLTVPLEFTFTRYGVEPLTGGAWGLRVITITQAKVLKVAPARGNYSPPSFVGVADVLDLRSPALNGAVQVQRIRDGDWSQAAAPNKSLHSTPR